MRPRGAFMSISTSLPPKSQIFYPEDDGEPMAENTVQFRWIVTVKEGLERVFRDRPDVFVAGDLLWYPVEGHPETRQAPDAMVVFGRPKGDRGSYMQWVEGGIAPQVVFEILSPGNRLKKMVKKFDFYQRHGVEEYYVYDPESFELDGWKRAGDILRRRLNETFPLSGDSGIRVSKSARRSYVCFAPQGGGRWLGVVSNSRKTSDESSMRNARAIPISWFATRC